MFFFFSSRRRHTRYIGDWSSDVCSSDLIAGRQESGDLSLVRPGSGETLVRAVPIMGTIVRIEVTDRKSTRLNSSHRCISYAVFCLKKKKNVDDQHENRLEQINIDYGKSP